MVDFRRVVTALAVLVLFVGLASAQVGQTGQSQLTCSTNVTVTPALRGEGYTEQTGDITITCTGGATMTLGQSIPLVNIAVFYNTTVTSRLLPTTSGANGQTSNSTSEALLLVDEPGSGLPGFGPSLNQTLCTTPLTGCQAWVGIPTQGSNVSGVPGSVTTAGTGSGANFNPGTVPAPNVYQGVVSGNSVTFFGVPAMPPTTTGSRVYRITNVRVNAQPLAGGSASGASPVQASISISGATSLSISNSAPNVGFVSNGLTASASNGNNFNQCSNQTKTAITTLTFSENFGTAFKTRVNAASTTAYSGQINNPVTQNIPGAIYNSESNFVFPISGSQIAGLADFGTRLKATFNNIPSGASVFVSTSNVTSTTAPILAPPGGGAIGGSTGNGNATSGAYVGFAQLVNGETTNDGNAGVTGFFPNVSPTDTVSASNTVPIAQVSITNGTGTAVWEVINTNPNTNESFKFAAYISYTANVATNTPLPGQATVNLSYAPTATSGVASATLPIPRFAGDTNAARNIFNIVICRTVLLYPYLTNQAGFDTGVTVANTTQDPFGTGAQSGSCKLNWYGGTTAAPTTPPGPSDTGTIAAGSVYANTLQTLVPNFQGYMIAVCNFQFAHGFAFISDVGARNLAMGYLAVVLNDPGTTTGGRATAATGVPGSLGPEVGGH